MPTPFATTRRVEFGETDMAGIVHFSNFFRYMEAAETDFLRSKGLTVSWTDAGRKFGFPRVSATCDYTRPAKFGDLLDVTVTVEKIGRTSVSYRYDFARAGVPLAVGRITAVFCQAGDDQAMQSIEIPANIRSLLEA